MPTGTDRDLGLLNSLARTLSQSLELDQVLGSALDRVAELLQLETGWVWILDEATSEPRLAASRNLPPGLIEHPELMEGDCYCLRTYAAGDLRGAANVNVVWCSRLEKLVEGRNELRCHASIPLYAGERKLGILNVASRDWRVLSPDELNLLYTVGALVSLAMERTRLVARSAALAAAEERNRLAREIHDTLAQSLAALAMQLETADALAEARNDSPLLDQIRRALQLTRATLDEARRSVVELRGAPLAGRTLAAALRELPDELQQQSAAPIAIIVEADDVADVAHGAVAPGLYHIAREALINVIRHAGASSALVRLERRGDQLHLSVSDNGAGLDPSNMAPGRFGLLGMNERAHLLGGELRIASNPREGRGTTIEVDVPLVSHATAVTRP